MRDDQAQQLAYYREKVDPESEITRPHSYPRAVRFLLNFKLSEAWELLRRPAPYTTVLVVCAGSGMDSEFLFRRGMRVVATDLSFDALLRARQRAQRYGLDYTLVVADAARLPFRDDAVDVAFVHDGLHHLPDPAPAIREMIRTCRTAVAMVEPAESPITGLAKRVGLSADYEEVGNRVYRFTARQLIGIFQHAGTTGWGFRRHLVYYQPWTFRIYRIFEPGASFWLFRLGFRCLDALLGRWGNTLQAVAWKPQQPGPPGPSEAPKG
ncbi:MAG: class I SAM-dependent methyltransferase [Armatimonadota bacterium]